MWHREREREEKPLECVCVCVWMDVRVCVSLCVFSGARVCCTCVTIGFGATLRATWFGFRGLQNTPGDRNAGLCEARKRPNHQRKGGYVESTPNEQRVRI